VSEIDKTDFGTTLRAAREARGISLRQIANTTKISVAALIALERNDVSRLPGGIFTRSFIRSYADEVGLDPEQAIRDFLAQCPVDDVADESPYAGESQEHDLFLSQQRVASTVLRLVLVSAPVVGFLLFLGLRGGDDVGVGPAAEPTERVVTEEAPLPEVVPSPSAALVVAEMPPVPEAAASGPLMIDIHPSAACWVSLTLDGERMFSRVMQPGEREVFEAEREIIVNVGDAGAFEFAINQQPGRALGRSGEVVTARINRDNYRSFVTQ
jgi:transcriptional regulator with XRE-family HTH domain